MKKYSFEKADKLLLICILMLAFALRLYKIDAPLADYHSWRQTDTAAVARNFERSGFNLLKPQYNDLSNLQSGIDNPNGYRFVEFPLYNATFAKLHQFIPFFSLDVWGRLVSVFFSLLIIFCLYHILLIESGRVAAVFSALTYAVMPFFVFFSRVILPETPAVGFAILSIYAFFLFESEKKKEKQIVLFFLSSIFFACALLVKPTTIFFVIPLIFLSIRKYRFNIPKQLHLIVYFIIATFPFFLWRFYITKFPEGIPASNWLISQVNTFEGQKEIFMRPAFFRWIFFERINNLILGGYLTIFLVLGIIKKRTSYFLLSLISVGFVYVFVFQGGNVQHEYYQTLLFPSLAVAIGLGVSFLTEQKKAFIHPVASGFVIFLLYILSFFFSWFLVKGYYHVPQDMLFMAKIIQTFSKPEDKIVVDRMGDTTLLYLSDRKGAPLLYKTPEEFKNEGYSFVLTDKQEIVKQLKDKGYVSLFENKQFSLFAL